MFSKFKLIKTWFKEYSRRCPRKIYFTIDDPPFLIIGHRGAPYKEPENTFPSFNRALEEGANGLEIDLSLTKDGHVIIWHDWDPNDTTALLREAGFEPWVRYKPHPPSILSGFRKAVNLLLLDEVRANFDYKERKSRNPKTANAHIPTLEEFFEWAADKNRLQFVFFDNKAPEADKGCAVEILDRLKELKEKYNPHFKIIIETTYIECFNEMKKNHPDFSFSLDIESPAGIIFEPEDYSALNAALKNNNNFAVGLRPRKITIANWTTFRRIMMLDADKLRSLRKKNTDLDIKLIAATVSKRKELRCLVRLGVDGIQTDFPGRLKKIAEHYKRKISTPEISDKVAV